LFLNWLRFQLNYSWQQIIAAGAATLGDVYRNLAGRTDGFQRFKAQLEANYPSGTSSNLTTDQPYPLLGLDNIHAADGNNAGRIAGSGATASNPKVNTLNLDVSKMRVRALSGNLSSFFSRISPDANPGRSVLTISGLPVGTRVISVWMTEWILGDQPHAGSAFFYTSSVQLYNNGTQCRVVYNLDWSGHLPAACQVIYGPG